MLFAVLADFLWLLVCCGVGVIYLSVSSLGGLIRLVWRLVYGLAGRVSGFGFLFVLLMVGDYGALGGVHFWGFGLGVGYGFLVGFWVLVGDVLVLWI